MGLPWAIGCDVSASDDGCACTDRIIAVTPALQVAGAGRCEAMRQSRVVIRTERGLRLAAWDVLLADDSRQRPYQNEGLNRGLRQERLDIAFDAVEGEAGPVLVEASGIDGNDRRSEKVNPVLSTDSEVGSVPGPAVICPVADADNALVAKLEFLPADEEVSRLVVEVKIALAEVEGGPHIGGDITHWQTKGMGVEKLEIAGEPVRRSHRETTPHSCELVEAVLA